MHAPKEAQGYRRSVLDSVETLERQFISDQLYEKIEIKVYHWIVENWKEQSSEIFSPPFKCGGHTWKIKLHPKYPKNPGSTSLYVELVKNDESNNSGHVCAQVVLFVSNPSDPTVFWHRDFSHRFTPKEMDWGFHSFISLSETNNPCRETRPFLENGRIRFTALVRVVKDSTGTLWQNSHTTGQTYKYNSKRETGYVGLKNQGVTGYMNAALQALYCTGEFRRMVYQIPTGNDDPTDSVALALQQLFYRLQISTDPVETTGLTKSFGWNQAESLLQRDAQEINRALQDSFLKRMKSGGPTGELFLGRMISHIRCTKIDLEERVIKEFYDIQLDVRGCRTLRDAFLEYTAEETLDGKNKYMTKSRGLQNAKKKDEFYSLPPILYLQIERFESDLQVEEMAKANSRFEFPETIDLEEFVSTDADQPESYQYTLYGVLVRSYELHGEQYYAIFKPEKNGRWIKFNDDRVTFATNKEVFEDNFGSDPNDLPPTAGAQPMYETFTSVYMLIYIRSTDIGRILSPVTLGDVPQHLKKRKMPEGAAKHKQDLSVLVEVVDDEIAKTHNGFGIVNFNDRSRQLTQVPTFFVKRHSTFEAFKKQLEGPFNVPSNNFRLWMFVSRNNEIIRLDYVEDDIKPRDEMSKVYRDLFGDSGTMRFYLERANLLNPEKPFLSVDNRNKPNANCHLFVKFFNPAAQRLEYLKKICVPLDQKVETVLPTLKTLIDLPSDTRIKIFEERKSGPAIPVELNESFRAAKLYNSSIICFQLELSNQDCMALPSGVFCTALKYYERLQKSLILTFKPRLSITLKESPTLGINLHKGMGYDEVVEMLSERLGVASHRLKLMQCQSGESNPKMLFRNPQLRLEDILPFGLSEDQNAVLYDIEPEHPPN